METPDEFDLKERRRQRRIMLEKKQKRSKSKRAKANRLKREDGESIFLENLGNYIRDERLRRCMTRDDLAKIAKVSNATITSCEGGINSLHIFSLMRVCRALGISEINFDVIENYF